MSQTERIETGKKLIEAISRDAASREEAWRFVTLHWLPDFINRMGEAGWPVRDAELGLAAVILRVNRLLGIRFANQEAYLVNRLDEVKRRLGSDFFNFLEKGILDALLMKDMQNYDGKESLPYMKRHWMESIAKELYRDSDVPSEPFEEIYLLALVGLKHRVAQNYISLKEYPLLNYLFDECLIALIEAGQTTANRAFHYIQTHWYEYLTSVIPKHEYNELRADTFNEVMGDFWKRVTQPQKNERLFLRDRLKTYLYVCMRNKYPDKKKELGGSTTGSRSTNTGPLIASEFEVSPTKLLPAEYDNAESTSDRWTSFALTNSERRMVIKHLTPGCKQLFELDADGLRDAEIARNLKFTSVDYVKNKRYKCNAMIEAFIQKLRKQKK
ncbi:MAG: hypothetical protein DYG98_08630 [Haliscomenobacteraceae bacterium CHB4]|nr:hypothetical protein [Haliscomenobacteraceae bacterium CHB4]